MKLFGFLRIIFERQGPEKGTFLFLLSLHDQIQILELTIKDFQNPLNCPITLNELQDKIQTLQPKKACGILNDKIYRLQMAILKTF